MMSRRSVEHSDGFITDGNGRSELGARPRWSLRGTFQKMSDWGDDFERRHFNGDFKRALATAPRRTLNRINDWGDEIERQHGDFAGAVSSTLAQAVSTVERFDEYASRIVSELEADREAAGYTGSSSSSSGGHQPRAAHVVLPVAATAAAGSPSQTWTGGAAASWQASTSTSPTHFPIAASDGGGEHGLLEESQRLQAEIAGERDRRKGRATALDALERTIKSLQDELTEARRQVLRVEAQEAAEKEECSKVLRTVKMLQDKNYSTLSRKVHQEAELRRLEAVAAAEVAARARAFRECEEEGPRAWARPGSETDALKEAKVNLALVLTEVDEQRLERRRDLKALQAELEELEAENNHLRRGPDYYVAPANSFRASISRLFAVARGQGDPHAGLERSSCHEAEGAAGNSGGSTAPSASR